MSEQNHQKRREDDHNRNKSVYRYILDHLTDMTLSEDKNNKRTPNQYHIAQQWGENRVYIRRVLHFVFSEEYYDKETLEKDKTIPGITVGKLVDILVSLQNYWEKKQEDIPDEQMPRLITKQEKIRVLKKFVQLLPDEQDKLGVAIHPQESLLEQLKEIITDEVKGLNKDQIIAFYKQAITIYHALKRERLSSDNPSSNKIDNPSSLEDKIRSLITKYIQTYYSGLQDNKKEKKINDLVKKVKKEISRIQLQSGMIHDQAIDPQSSQKNSDSFEESFFYPSFLEDLISPIVENDFLGDEFPIYIHHFEFQKIEPLPLQTNNTNHDQGLLNESLSSSEDLKYYIEGLKKQIVYKVRVYFYINLKRTDWKTNFSKEIEGIYKEEEHRLEFFEEVRGIGSPISLIIRAINKFLFENISLLKEYFPVAQEILNEDKIMGNGSNSPIRSYTLIRLCRKQDIKKAIKNDSDYDQVAADQELSSGEYCGFDLVEVAAKTALYARLRAIQKTKINPQEYIKQLCDSIQEKYFLRKAKKYLYSYPFSLRVMENYLNKTIFQDKYRSWNDKEEKFIDLNKDNPWSIVAYEAHLKIAQTYLQEGLYRFAKKYLDCIDFHIQRKNLDDPILITLYHLCQFRYHFLTDLKDLEKDHKERSRAITQAQECLDNAEETLINCVKKYKIIGETSQINAHPFYHLLSRIYAHKAKSYIFFPDIYYYTPRDSRDREKEKSKLFNELLIEPIKLLEKARIQIARDGDANHYAYWTVYQIWCYLIAAYLGDPKELGEEFNRAKSIERSKRLMNHGLSCYTELGKAYYQQIKHHSGKQTTADPVNNKHQSDLFYEQYKDVNIQTIPPIIEVGENIPNLDKLLHGKFLGDGILLLDMSMLTKRLEQFPGDLTSDKNVVYLFGVYSSILLFGLGMVELCDDDENEMEKRLKDAMKHFTLCAATAADGSNDGGSEKDGKVYLKRKFENQNNIPEEFRIRGLYPHRLTHFAVLGKIFAATCKVILTVYNSEDHTYWGEIEYLLSDLHNQETINKSKNYVFKQKRYNGHLASQCTIIKRYLENYLYQENTYSDLRKLRDIIVRDVFKSIRGDNIGVADCWYDFYLLEIAKLLHDQYFRLLDFYFHTLIQQRHNIN